MARGILRKTKAWSWTEDSLVVMAVSVVTASTVIAAATAGE